MIFSAPPLAMSSRRKCHIVSSSSSSSSQLPMSITDEPNFSSRSKSLEQSSQSLSDLPSLPCDKIQASTSKGSHVRLLRCCNHVPTDGLLTKAGLEDNASGIFSRSSRQVVAPQVKPDAASTWLGTASLTEASSFAKSSFPVVPARANSHSDELPRSNGGEQVQHGLISKHLLQERSSSSEKTSAMVDCLPSHMSSASNVKQALGSTTAQHFFALRSEESNSFKALMCFPLIEGKSSEGKRCECESVKEAKGSEFVCEACSSSTRTTNSDKSSAKQFNCLSCTFNFLLCLRMAPKAQLSIRVPLLAEVTALSCRLSIA
mmetsp:Transcript_20681/g.38721  ORF Transcript_20681/g.38721 Transcript_20681/m.38721 type:complete len:318 (+) Transcript_20681:436-1389(+)